MSGKGGESNARLEAEIAERTRIARELADSEERYRTLVSQVRDYAIFAMDADGSAISWNEGVESVLGYGREEFIGSPVELPFLPEDIAAGAPWRELETARAAGVASDDRWLRRKDGSPFYAVGLTTRRTDERGQCIGFTKVFRDETQRVTAEAALRESEARFRTLVDNLHDYAIFMLDANGFITEWPAGAHRVTGFSASEVIGKHLAMFCPPESGGAAAVADELAEAAASGRAEREGWRMTKSGRLVWINEIATALYDAHGRTIGFTKISRDLTERKRAEDSLREADRRKDEFLATLAHELRNPLAPLRNGIEILRLAGPPGSPSLATVDMMHRQLTHLVRLVDDLLDVARISSGKVELRKGPVSLLQIIATSIEATRTLVRSHRHELSVDIAGGGDLHVDGDFDRLAQVLSNLLSNAAKYTESGGRIVIRVFREGDEAVLKVVDTGIGIPPDDLPHVFDLFSQVRTHQGRAEGGLGIGLSLVKSLVNLHGGTISAHSDGAGKGSEFVVRLPLLSRPDETPAAMPPPLPDLKHGGTQRILVVDDNVDTAMSLATLLTMRGHDVAVAHDGENAIDKARQLKPHVVMMDIGMPLMDGCEAARRLRALPGGEQMRLIAITGWSQDADRERSRAAGFDFHLVKPANPEQLASLLWPERSVAR